MNILLIPHLPILSSRGFEVCKYLSKKHQMHFIIWDMPYPITLKNIINTLFNSLRSYKYKEGHVTIHKIRRFPFFIPPLNKFLFKLQIKNICSEYNINLIYSQSYFNETEPPFNMPLIYDMVDHHEAFKDNYGSFFYKLGYIFLEVNKTIRNQIKKSKAVIAASSELKKYISQYTNKKIHVIPNAAEDWILQVPYKKVRRYSLVYVTNFGPWSMTDALLEAIACLKGKYKTIKLTLIGDGVEIPKIKKIIRNYNIEKQVKITGFIKNRRSLINIINKHEICINLSETNTFRNAASPMKVYEYSALGKKIISSNLNEVILLNLPNIFLYNNIDDMAKIIETVFNSNFNAAKVKEHMRLNTWKFRANDLEKLFIKIK